ncbi:MAG: SDR family oxidoreductase [Oscillospiraceae bacterium]
MIKRMAQPEEQAALACFLASDDASYIDGEIIYSAAGWGLS